MKRLVFLASLTTALLGCGKSEPALSGGKPVSYWVDALRAPDPRVRKEAAFKLGNAGPIEPTVYPAVVAALGDADAQVRVEVVKSLVKFGPAAKEAVPTLTELQQKDPDARVRTLAGRAIDLLRSWP
jgi:HEAT repeat protein